MHAIAISHYTIHLSVGAHPFVSISLVRKKRKRHMKKTRIIINPFSHHGVTARLEAAIRELFLDDNDVEFFLTKEAGHATQLAAESAGTETVIAVGGDGTINEIISGLMSISAEQRPALGIIPSGSGNDAARAVGVPVDISRSFALIKTGTPQLFDVGRCNDRYFFSSFSVGLDALVVAKTIEYKARHQSAGLWLYLSALLHVAFHDYHSLNLEIATNGGTPEEKKITLCAVTNGQTYGGGIRICPSAQPNDGLLNNGLLTFISFPKFITRLPLIAIARQDRIREFSETPVAQVSLASVGDKPIIAQADGEVFTDTHFEISVIPSALRVITA